MINKDCFLRMPSVTVGLFDAWGELPGTTDET